VWVFPGLEVEECEKKREEEGLPIIDSYEKGFAADAQETCWKWLNAYPQNGAEKGKPNLRREKRYILHESTTRGSFSNIPPSK